MNGFKPRKAFRLPKRAVGYYALKVLKCQDSQSADAALCSFILREIAGMRQLR